MTAPRQILEGATYLITRRCSERRYFLRPSDETNAIFLYVLALAAARFGVQIHAFCVLSNHFHLVLTDPDAQLPAFEQYLDSLVARAVNASLGRWEAFWAPSSYSAVVLTGPEDIVAKTAYVLANPVAGGLVRSAREWPGNWTAPDRLGTARLTARRPAKFFRGKGGLADEAVLDLVTPPGVGSAEDFQRDVAVELARLEDRARRDHDLAGRPFLGAARVLRQEPTARPVSVEPRRELKPRIAARDEVKRVEVLTRLREFVRSYREAWAAWRTGRRDVVFPAGTYLLRILHGAPCLAPS